MNLIKIAEQVTRSLENLVVHPENCSRICSRLSTCEACETVCPVNGINIENGEISITNCTECGICTTACPTGALTWKSLATSHLPVQINQFIEQGELVLVHCQKYKPDHRSIHTIEVPCLAVLTSELWYLMLAAPERFNIYLPDSACTSCEVTHGENLRLAEIARAESWADSRRIRYLTTVAAPQKKENIDSRKRNWLTALFGTARAAPVSAIHQWASEVDVHKALQLKWMSPRRKLLRLISRQGVLGEVTMKLPIIHANCEFCTACSKLCPNKALRQEQQTISVDPFLCTECKLCVDICYHNAIELREIRAVTATSTERMIIAHRDGTVQHEL